MKTQRDVPSAESPLERCLSGIVLDRRRLLKRRFGEIHDGGYVLADPGRALAGLLSFGVGKTTLFEETLQGAWQLPEVWLCDPTVEAPQGLPEGFQFSPSGLKGASGRSGLSLDAWVQKLSSPVPRSWILKIDIEGDEWAALDQASERAFDPFLQVVIELHHWESDADQFCRVYEKLARHFVLVHGHANNHAGLLRVGAMNLPEVLELTWVAKDRMASMKRGFSFRRRPLDAPNNGARPELPGNYWPLEMVSDWDPSFREPAQVLRKG